MSEQKVCAKCGSGLHEVYFEMVTKYRCMECEYVYSDKCLNCKKVEVCKVKDEVLGCALFEEK